MGNFNFGSFVDFMADYLKQFVRMIQNVMSFLKNIDDDDSNDEEYVAVFED